MKAGRRQGRCENGGRARTTDERQLWDQPPHRIPASSRSLQLLGQTKVGVNDKGELTIPALLGRNGRPREWVEIAPFVWRDAMAMTASRPSCRRQGGALEHGLHVAVHGVRSHPGQVQCLADPGAVHRPRVLLLTFLALAGRLVPPPHNTACAGRGRQGASAASCDADRSGLSLGVLIGWIAGVHGHVEQPEIRYRDQRSLPVAAAGLGVLVFVGTILASGRNAQLALSDGRSRWRKLWSVLVLASSLVLFYVALRFGLIALTVNY
jgi:hypothetical protein